VCQELPEQQHSRRWRGKWRRRLRGLWLSAEGVREEVRFRLRAKLSQRRFQLAQACFSLCRGRVELT
jgi:hypothetical protein